MFSILRFQHILLSCYILLLFSHLRLHYILALFLTLKTRSFSSLVLTFNQVWPTTFMHVRLNLALCYESRVILCCLIIWIILHNNRFIAWYLCLQIILYSKISPFCSLCKLDILSVAWSSTLKWLVTLKLYGLWRWCMWMSICWICYMCLFMFIVV